MCVGEAVVFYFSPDTFEGDVADGFAGVVADELTELEEVLVGPFLAVSPAGLFFEKLYYLSDQVFVGLHSNYNFGRGPVTKIVGSGVGGGLVPTCTNVYRV